MDAWNDVDYSGLMMAGAEQRLARGEFAHMNNELVQMKIKVILGEVTIDKWDHYVREITDSARYKDMMARLNALLP